MYSHESDLDFDVMALSLDSVAIIDSRHVELSGVGCGDKSKQEDIQENCFLPRGYAHYINLLSGCAGCLRNTFFLVPKYSVHPIVLCCNKR